MHKSKIIKILSYLVVSYVVIQGIIVFYNLVSKEKRKTPHDTYTTEDIVKFYNDCIINGKVTHYYPEIAKINCQCLTDSLTKKYTKAELIGFEQIPPEKKYALIKDIIIYCAQKSGRDTVHIFSK